MRRLSVLMALVLPLIFLTAPSAFAQEKLTVVTDPKNDVKLGGTGCAELPGMRALDIRQVSVQLVRSDSSDPWAATVRVYVKDVPKPTKTYREGPRVRIYLYRDDKPWGTVEVETNFDRGRVVTTTASYYGNDPAAATSLDERGAFYEHAAVLKFRVPTDMVLTVHADAFLSRVTDRKRCYGVDKRKDVFGPTPV